MDSPRHHSWLYRAGLAALAYVSLICCGVAAGTPAPTHQFQDSRASSTTAVQFQRNVILKYAGTGSLSLRVRRGAAYAFATVSVSSSVPYNAASPSNGVGMGGWTGLSSGSGPVTSSSAAGGWLLSWYLTSGDTSVNDFQVAVPAQTYQVSFKSGDQSYKVVNLDPVTITIGPDGKVVSVEDPLGQEEDPEKEMEKGIMLLDNRTGEDMLIPFGDEELLLKPGYNAFPFYGEVDENGFPSAMGDMNLGREEGADGQTYWTGRIVPDGEAPPRWTTPPGIEVFPPSSGSTGPTVKLPSGMTQASGSDYLTLPPGMTKGNSNNPLPPGMTFDNGSNPLPPGVTLGSSGGLPNGVISGGTNHLPPGMSAGTVKGNTPSAGGGSGGSGGTGGSSGGGGGTGGTSLGGGVQAPSTSDNSGGPYVPGASMNGFEDLGRKMGSDAAEKIGKEVSDGLKEMGDGAKGFFGEGGRWKFWNAPGEAIFSGADTSWANFSLPIAGNTVNIVIPPNWLELIRSIMVWGVKLWFVVACIKLVMK